ncbi:MAG: hypothetical protein JWQ38_2171 [Flavipsychrobacter sp.]|nr:hypothetical protein [Flavipsychrobacter sp.]
MCLALTLVTIASAQTRKDLDDAADKFQIYYNKNQPDSLYNIFSQRVKNMMTLDGTKAMFKKMNEEGGKIKSHSFIKQDDRFTFYKIMYTKSTMALVISLNDEKTLQSFRVMAYEGDDAKLK